MSKFPDRRGLAQKYYPKQPAGRALDSELPLFAYLATGVDHRRFRCPHCGSAITFSQLGHAVRWGWCPHCLDGGLLTDLMKQKVLTGLISRRELRYAAADGFGRGYNRRVSSALLCWLYKHRKGLL